MCKYTKEQSIAYFLSSDATSSESIKHGQNLANILASPQVTDEQIYEIAKPFGSYCELSGIYEFDHQGFARALLSATPAEEVPIPAEVSDICRQAWNDMFHKVKPSVDYVDFSNIWNMCIERMAAPSTAIRQRRFSGEGWQDMQAADDSYGEDTEFCEYRTLYLASAAPQEAETVAFFDSCRYEPADEVSEEQAPTFMQSEAFDHAAKKVAEKTAQVSPTFKPQEQAPNPRDIYMICNSYESGFGHGAKKDGLDLSRTPHADPEHGKAYQIGYEAGERRSQEQAPVDKDAL